MKLMTFNTTLAYTTLHPYFQQRIHQNEPLARHSSFGVGGSADIWLSIEHRKELNDLISLCAQEQWPLLVVGASSNILYADAGVRGIVASIAMQNYTIEEQSAETALVIADAGVRWGPLLKELLPLGWSGLEFGIGIPGTLGAGVISNVGTRNQNLGQVLEWIEILDASSCNRTEIGAFPPVTMLRRYQYEDLDLRYRHSRFRNHRLTYIDAQGQLVFPKRGLIDPAELIVTLSLRVHRADPTKLGNLLQQYMQEREQDDPEQQHLGSIFKDPTGTTAHALIEQAGLAGKKHGNAQISERNANYFVNLGGAAASDIIALIIEAHQQVLAKSGVQLSPNIELLGEWQEQA